MAKIKPKDIKTKHKAGEYIYVRKHKKICSEYSITRVLIKEIIITIGESSVEIHYDAGGEMFPEAQTSSTIQEAEAIAIAELAAYKLKGKSKVSAPKKKFKPARGKKKARKKPYSKPDPNAEDDEDDDEEDIDDGDYDDDEEDEEDDDDL